MSVRRQICRYSEPPYGADYDDVLKKAKRYFRSHGVFEMCPFKNLWFSNSETLGPFIAPQGMRKYKFDVSAGRWLEITAK